MIVNYGNTVIDEDTFRPLVMVKNGPVTRLTTDGLLDISTVKKLRLPKARYDYTLHMKFFTWTNGVKTFNGDDVFYIDKKQTELEFNYGQVLATIEAELVTTEV